MLIRLGNKFAVSGK